MNPNLPDDPKSKVNVCIKNVLQDKAYKTLPEHRKYTEHYIESLKSDVETVKSVKPFTNVDAGIVL